MRNLKFDDEGYLMPKGANSYSLEGLKKTFVFPFSESRTREKIFDNYERYLFRFQDEVFPHFEQWLNGSFVSKKLNPNDLDMVTFVDYRVFEERPEKLLDKFWSFSLETEGIDAYLVKAYPPNHRMFSFSMEQREIWAKRFSWTKPDSNGMVRQKGFLQLKFGV